MPAAFADRDRRRLLRESSSTSAAAVVAVLSGLLLDVTIAARYGAGTTTDAFFVGARVPLGLVQVVLMVGANQVLVPAVSNWFVQGGSEAARGLSARLLNAAFLAGAVVCVAAWFLAWPITWVLAPGLDPDTSAAAVAVTRILFLAVPLAAATEVLRAYLNASYSFVVPTAMNVVLNITAAAGVIAVGGGSETIAWAYVAGAVARLGFMLATSLRHGLRVRLDLHVLHPEIVAVGRLCLRPFAAAGLGTSARFVEVALASFLPPGSISLLQYAHRLIAGTSGTVFFRSVIVPVVPRLSESAARGDDATFRRTTGWGLELVVAIALPLTALVAVLAEPAAALLFRRGGFGEGEATLLGTLLLVLSLSLTASALQRALLVAFYARLDVRTPLRNAILTTAANAAVLPFALLAGDPARVLVGMGLAFSLSQYVSPLHAAWHLRRSGSLPRVDGRVIAASAVGALAAAGVMLGSRALVGLTATLGAPGLTWRMAAVSATGAAALIATVIALLPPTQRAALRGGLRGPGWRRRVVEPAVPVEGGVAA